MKTTAIFKAGSTPTVTGSVQNLQPTTNPALWGLTSNDATGGKVDDRFVTEVEVAGRPSNIIYRMSNKAPWWNFYSLMDGYRREVSILDTIIMRSVTELFRYGIDFEPAFTKKCVDCGEEYQTNVKVCKRCNSKRLIDADPLQKDYFKRNGVSMIDKANARQSLKDVCRSYAEMQYQNNQAYMLCVTADIVDTKTKQFKRSMPMEFLSIDPKFVRMLYDDRAETGELYGFISDDRSTLISLPKDKDTVDAYHKEGKVINPAHWLIGDSVGATGHTIAYKEEEVYQDHWFRQSLIYGIPHWLSIEDDLLAWHYMEKNILKKYQCGYARKIIVLPGFDETVAKQVATGVQNVLAKNAYSIPIVALPPQMPGSGELRAQTLELGAESGGDLIQQKNEIRDRLCAHAGVPNLFAGDVEGSGGLNNESQQITTFDRYLMDKYDYIDNLLDWILSWFPKITDWKLRVVRPSKADQENKKLQEELQIASAFKQLGFAVTYVNGEFSYSEKPVENPQQQQGAFAPQGSIGTPQQRFGTGNNQMDSDMMGTKDEINDAFEDANDLTKSKGSDKPFRISVGDIRGAVRKVSD